MNVLVFNTTTMVADIVLYTNNEKIFSRLDTVSKHSESLMVKIDDILQSNNLEVSDIDYIGVCVGPGSFTGIRLSLAIMKGFMTANPKIKAVGFTTLEMMQKCYNSNESVAYVMNALSGKYYVKLSDGEPFLSYDIANLNCPIIGLREESLPFANSYIDFDPQIMLELVLEKIELKQVSDDLSPLYLRKSQAEENLNADKKND